MEEVTQAAIKTKMMMILGMAYEISTETKADVFVYYFPHTKSIDIHVFKDGWHAEADADFRWDTYNATKQELNEIIEKLQKLHAELIKEGKVL